MEPDCIDKIPGVFDTPCFERWEDLVKYKKRWEDLVKYKKGKKDKFVEYKWAFRAQSDATWRIKSTFERAKKGRGEQEAWKYEAAMLREFKRRAHHYTSSLPTSDDVLEWFALMRHYGAPSRLVDFTYSFYIAAYLTLTKMSSDKELGAIWAVNEKFLTERYEKAYNVKKGGSLDYRFKDPKTFRKIFLNHKGPKSFAMIVNPFRLNERLTAQQGVFVCPSNINKPFMVNLLGKSTKRSELNVVRFIIKPSMREEAMRHLRSMNITSATLFPDLIGFAKSLSDWFDMPFHYEDKVLDEALKGIDYKRHP